MYGGRQRKTDTTRPMLANVVFLGAILMSHVSWSGILKRLLSPGVTGGIAIKEVCEDGTVRGCPFTAGNTLRHKHVTHDWISIVVGWSCVYHALYVAMSRQLLSLDIVQPKMCFIGNFISIVSIIIPYFPFVFKTTRLYWEKRK